MTDRDEEGEFAISNTHLSRYFEEEFEDEIPRPGRLLSLNDGPSDYVLGRAFKSLTDRISGRLAITVPETLTPHERRRTKWRIRKIEERETLRKVLQVSAGASLIGTGSAKVDFYRSLKTSKYSLFLYVDVQTITHEFALRENVLRDELKADLSSPSIDALYKNYGDKYISVANYGGEFIALIQFVATTEEEYQRLSAAAEGSSGDFSFSADFSNSIERMREFSSLDASYYLAGAKGGFPEIESTLKYAKDFPDKVGYDGVQELVEVGTAPLNEATGFPIRGPQLDLAAASAALEGLHETKEKAIDIDVVWALVIARPYYFIGEDLAVAAGNRSTLDALFRQISAESSSILQAPYTHVISPIGIGEELFKWPKRVPTFAPTLRVEYRGVKRNPSSGSGVFDKVIDDFAIVNIKDTESNWFPVRRGSFTNIRWITIYLKKPLPNLEIRYRAKFAGVAQPTDWVPLGNRLRSGNQLISAIAFDLQGQMKDAYWIEYQIHAMNTGDSETWGNTERAGLGRPLGDFANKQFRQIEGIRLAIWPKD